MISWFINGVLFLAVSKIAIIAFCHKQPARLVTDLLLLWSVSVYNIFYGWALRYPYTVPDSCLCWGKIVADFAPCVLFHNKLFALVPLFLSPWKMHPPLHFLCGKNCMWKECRDNSVCHILNLKITSAYLALDCSWIKYFTVYFCFGLFSFDWTVLCFSDYLVLLFPLHVGRKKL